MQLHYQTVINTIAIKPIKHVISGLNTPPNSNLCQSLANYSKHTLSLFSPFSNFPPFNKNIHCPLNRIAYRFILNSHLITITHHSNVINSINHTITYSSIGSANNPKLIRVLELTKMIKLPMRQFRIFSGYVSV